MSAQTDQNDEWTEFLDRLVHDMREPLRSINAFSELLREMAKGRLGSDGDEVLGEILSGTARIRTLVDGLAGYSLALRASSESAASEGTALQSAFNIAVAALGDQIEARGATVTGIEVPNGGPVRVAMSLERLMQLLENLIGNALRFRAEEPLVVKVSAHSDGEGTWTVQVADNGMGINGEDQETVFKPFMRVQGRKYGGAGLGLSICQRIVEGHGGSIEMAPRPGGGTICTFTVPAA
jgi:chemotaxis family two-component system sensor kinase Cph1